MGQSRGRLGGPSARWAWVQPPPPVPSPVPLKPASPRGSALPSLWQTATRLSARAPRLPLKTPALLRGVGREGAQRGSQVRPRSGLQVSCPRKRSLGLVLASIFQPERAPTPAPVPCGGTPPGTVCSLTAVLGGRCG